MSDYKKDIETKLKITMKEFGVDALNDAVLIGDFMTWDNGRIAGFECIDAKTLPMGACILGRVGYRVARFFEDIVLPKED